MMILNCVCQHSLEQSFYIAIDVILFFKLSTKFFHLFPSKVGEKNSILFFFHSIEHGDSKMFSKTYINVYLLLLKTAVSYLNE